MNLSEADIAGGFWRYRPGEDFPPDPVRRLEDYDGAERLNLACTQTDLTPYRQRKLVEAWCEALPGFTSLRFLWMSTRVSQAMFEAACRVPRLEGLYVKWGGIDDLSPILRRMGLRFLHIGSSPGITSVECLSEMRSLEVLELENLHRIDDVSVIGRLEGLLGLALYGGEGGWRIRSLGPLSRLGALRYLFMPGVRPEDGSLRPLHELGSLRTLRLDSRWSQDEVLDLQLRRPQLRIS
ncbi:MAG: hypothetical protein ACODAA_09875 [Gemmatimonadota bacterium]